MSADTADSALRSLGYEPSFRRILTRRSLILYGLVILTPTAPYPVYGIVQQMSKGHAALCYLAAMLAMLFTAVSYGRMAGAFPAAGSTYTFVQRGLNAHVGFIAGWGMILDYIFIPMLSVIYAALTAERLLPQVPYLVWAVLFAVSITWINLRGMQQTARAGSSALVTRTPSSRPRGVLTLLKQRQATDHLFVQDAHLTSRFGNILLRRHLGADVCELGGGLRADTRELRRHLATDTREACRHLATDTREPCRHLATHGRKFSACLVAELQKLTAELADFGLDVPEPGLDPAEASRNTVRSTHGFLQHFHAFLERCLHHRGPSPEQRACSGIASRPRAIASGMPPTEDDDGSIVRGMLRGDVLKRVTEECRGVRASDTANGGSCPAALPQRPCSHPRASGREGSARAARST